MLKYIEHSRQENIFNPDIASIHEMVADIKKRKAVDIHYMKSCGYHAWKAGVSLAVLMDISNHSSMEITKIHLAVDHDDKDEIYRKIVL